MLGYFYSLSIFMKLIVWLGNPWDNYTFTRHNIGFLVLDQYVRHNVNGDFLLDKKILGLILKTTKIIYLKPQTFMNLSWRSVKAVCTFFKIQPANILVIHDEIDLDGGVVKYKDWWGHAGHNGLRDMMKELGTNRFKRIRVGVGRPAHPGQTVSDHVLGKMSQQERDEVQDHYLKIESMIKDFINDNDNK